MGRECHHVAVGSRKRKGKWSSASIPIRPYVVLGDSAAFTSAELSRARQSVVASCVTIGKVPISG